LKTTQYLVTEHVLSYGTLQQDNSATHIF